MDRREEQEAIQKLLLAHLSNGEDGAVREMTSGLRDGTMSWREALSTSYYAESLFPHVRNFSGWYASLSESERGKEVETFRAELDRLRPESGPTNGQRQP